METMQMPKPTAAHSKLEQLAGTWIGTETCHPSPWNPELHSAKSKTVRRVALGGFHAIGDYEKLGEGEDAFTGHEIFSYEPDSDEYVCHWFDSMGPKGCALRGRWQGDTLTLLGHDPQFGHSRLIYGMGELAQGAYSFKMEMSPDGETWTPCIEGRYERQR